MPVTVRVQWKDTDACLHLFCDCGAETHSDVPYVETIGCPSCEARYDLPRTISIENGEEEEC